MSGGVMAMNLASFDYVLSLADPGATLETVGGKGASLARLVSAGMPVAYQRFAAENDLQPGILAALKTVDASRLASLEVASQAIRELFAGTQTPPDVAGAIALAYASLTHTNPVVAVPLSARSGPLAPAIPRLLRNGERHWREVTRPRHTEAAAIRGSPHICSPPFRIYPNLYLFSVPRHMDFSHHFGYDSRGSWMMPMFAQEPYLWQHQIPPTNEGESRMDRIHVMELVRSFQVGELARNEFVGLATAALGSGSLADLLVDASLSSPVKNPHPVVEAETGEVPAAGGPGTRADHLLVPSGSRVEYPDRGGEALEGYLARPEARGARPAVIVIQEWWGLNDHIRDVTRRFAHEGFVALAPDLYHGVVVSEPDEARKLVMELDMANAVREIRQAIDFLQGQDEVAGPKVGIVGFCMGGRLVLRTARVEPDLGAAVVFYGTPLTSAEAAEVKAPILGLYGTEDAGNPIDRVRAMEQALNQAGIENQIRIYAGAQHAFFNDTRASYHPEASADAWQRTLRWFRSHLGKQQST